MAAVGDGIGECRSCQSGYENHEYYCTNGEFCCKRSSVLKARLSDAKLNEAVQVTPGFIEMIRKTTSTPIFKTQVGGDHYTRMVIQPIEYALANNMTFIEANVVKYVSRWRFKGGVQDLKKAQHMLGLLISHEESMKREEPIL